MNLVLAKTDTGRPLSDVFAVVRDRLPGTSKIADGRRQAFESYEHVGLPHRRIVSLDTDGGMMFNLGILGTVANEQPPNPLVVVWDNECYQSIGGPPTHTASGRVDLAAIARGAGVEQAFTVRTVEEFDAHCARGLASEVPYIVVAKVAGTVQPDIKRKHSDGREDKYIFVRHVEASENIVIMGPSEHN